LIKEFVIKITVTSTLSGATYLEDIIVKAVVNSVTMQQKTNSSGVALFRAKAKNFDSTSTGTLQLIDPSGTYQDASPTLTLGDAL
jgi:hypothetical protein